VPNSFEYLKVFGRQRPGEIRFRSVRDIRDNFVRRRPFSYDESRTRVARRVIVASDLRVTRTLSILERPSEASRNRNRFCDRTCSRSLATAFFSGIRVTFRVRGSRFDRPTRHDEP